MSAVVDSPQLDVRPMAEQDLDDVMAVELSVYQFPWTRRIFLDCLRVGYSCLVGEVNGTIAGYVIMSSAADEAHVLNLCVAPEFQGQGLGKRLLLEAMDTAQGSGVQTLFLEVRPSNQRAKKLYDQLGFNEIGIRKDYYPAEDGREDAIILALNLGIWPQD